MNRHFRRLWAALAVLSGPALARAVVDHYVITAPSAIMKGASNISFSIDPQDALNVTDTTAHRVKFSVPPGVTVEGVSGTSDVSGAWEVSGVTYFTIRTNGAAPIGVILLRVEDKFDSSVFGSLGVEIEPTIVSYQLEPPNVPFTGSTGVGFNLVVRALGPGGVTITSYRDEVRLGASIGDLAVISGGSGDLVNGSSFVNGVASVVVTLFGTDPLTRQNTITAFQVKSYSGQPLPATGVTSPPLTINPNTYHHILLRFPGETLTPGTGSGKTGIPTLQVAGASINPVLVDLVDQWHNPIIPTDNLVIYPFTIQYQSFWAIVPLDTVPPDSVLNLTNQANVSFNMKMAGTHLIQASHNGSEFSQSNIPVINASGHRFKVTPDPMPNSDAVTPFLISVEAVDIYDNPLAAYNGVATVTADDCSGTPFGANTLDTAPGPTVGAQNTINFVAGQWLNHPIQVFKASNNTRLVFVDGGAGLSGQSTCFDNNPGGAAQLFFTLPGQIYTPGAYPGNTNAPTAQNAGALISATVRVTDLSWNQVGLSGPESLTVFMDNAVGFIEVPSGLIMPAVGDVVVNNIKLRTASFRPLAAAVPQVLQAQISSPNLFGSSSGITVRPGSYNRVIAIAPDQALSPGNPAGGVTGSVSTQAYNVNFPISVYLTDSLYNPIENPPYSGNVWPSIDFSLVGGGDITFPSPDPFPLSTSRMTGTVRSRKLGTNTIQATDTLNATRNDQVSITVDPGAVDRFVVTPNPLSETADPIPNQTAGIPFSLTIKAYDAYSNLARNFGGDVRLELWENGVPVPYPGTISPSTVTFVPDIALGGVVSTTFTITYAGSFIGNGPDQLQVRAFVTSPSMKEGKSAFFNVIESSPWSHLVLTLPGETRRPGLGPTTLKVGTPTAITTGNTTLVNLTATDDYGNRVDVSGLADLSIPTPNVFANLGVPAQVTLSNGQGTGTINVYTAGPSVLVASSSASGLSDQSSLTVRGGSYSAGSGKLVLLAPGETLIPGSTSAPGKNSVSISTVQANTAMAFNIYACDAYYNIDTSYSGNTVSLISDDGAIALSPIAVNSGSTTVNNVFLRGHLPNPSTVRVTADDTSDSGSGKTSYSDVPVSPGAAYTITVPPTALAGQTFPMTVELLDPDTGSPLVGANHSISLEGITPLGATSKIPLGITSINLVNGAVTFDQSYSYVETIKIRIRDSANRIADSGNITITPNGLKYIVTLPASKTTDDLFPVTVGLYDTIQDALPIEDSSYQHNFAVTVEAGGLPAVGSFPVSAATLTGGVASFNFSYTKAEHIVVRASGSVAGFTGITGIDDMDINPGAYVKLLALAPGELAVPGVPSLTGKDSSGLVSQAARESFSMAVNAVDRYWNTVSSLNTALSPSVRLTAADSSFTSVPLQPFSSGVALFSNLKLNTPPEVLVTAVDTANTGVFPQSVMIPVTGRVYVATATPNFGSDFYSGPPRDFNVDVSLHRSVNGSVGTIVSGFSGKVYVEPLSLSLNPLPVGNLVLVSPSGTLAEPNMFNMNNSGLLTITLAYRVAEDVILKFRDEDGWIGYSQPIHFIPTDVAYEVVVPTASPVGPPESFSMTVRAKDVDTGTTAKNWSALVSLTPMSQLTGFPGTGTLQVTSVNLSTGVGTVTFPQAYTQAGLFYFRATDGARTTDSVPMNFLPGPLAALTTNIPATVEAGTNQTVLATVLDAYSNPIPNLNVSFSLSDSSFGTFSTLTGVSNAVGQASTVLNTNAQKSGLVDFVATSGESSVRQAFRLLGPPSTSIQVGGLGVAMAESYALKPTDPISLVADVQPGMTLTGIQYSVNGGPFLNYTGPFTLGTVGVHSLRYFGTTQAGLTHIEDVKTSLPIMVSRETAPEEQMVNYPNPFQAGRDLTFLEFNLTRDSNGKLKIFDMLGSLVYEKEIIQGQAGGQTGLNRIGWDGRNTSGEVVANGGYIAVLELPQEGQTLKRKIAVRK